jgi:hypothetical protein
VDSDYTRDAGYPVSDRKPMILKEGNFYRRTELPMQKLEDRSAPRHTKSGSSS